MAAMFCSDCGTPTIAGDRYCRSCGASIFEATVDLPRGGMVAASSSYTPAAAYAPSAAYFGDEGGKPLLHFDVVYPGRLSRWKIFVKWLLAFPHIVVLYLFGIAAYVVTFIAWWAILFTGRYPEGMFNFMLTYIRWAANVGSYALLLRDEYPPFSGTDGLYPVQLSLAYPTSLSRWKIFFKWLLVIPNVIVFYFIIIAAYVCAFIAWWAILFTGRYPQGLFQFFVGAMRWGYRLNVYLLLLTDRYPPFSTAAVPDQGQQGQMVPA